MPNKKDIWIVVLAHNEAKYLGSFLEKLTKITRNILVVNDHSRDETVKIAKKYTKQVIDNDQHMGKGGAMRAGADHAFGTLGAEAVIFMDGDDQHHPDDLPKFYEALATNKYDVVFGVRSFGREMPLVRMVGNRVCSFLTYLFFGKYIFDIPSGFRAITKKAYSKIRWDYYDYTVELEIAVRTIQANLNYTFVDISTIYHDMDRGMKVNSVYRLVFRLLKWKVWGIE